MTLISGLQSGLQSGLLSGLNAGATSYSIATATPADIPAIVGGAEPSLMWRYDEASGATELVAGSSNLTDVSGPTKEVTSVALGGVLTTETAANGPQRMEAASGAVADVTTGTITVIHIYEMVTAPVASLQVMGKKGTNGYEIFANTSGHVLAFAKSTSSTVIPTIAIDHGTGNAETVLLRRSEADGETALYSRLGSSVLAAPGGSMTDVKVFSIGRNARSAANARHSMTMLWLGSDGDGFGETERSAIASAFGLE